MIEEKNKPNKNPIFNLGKFISEIHSKDLKEDSFTQSKTNDANMFKILAYFIINVFIIH